MIWHADLLYKLLLPGVHNQGVRTVRTSSESHLHCLSSHFLSSDSPLNAPKENLSNKNLPTVAAEENFSLQPLFRPTRRVCLSALCRDTWLIYWITPPSHTESTLSLHGHVVSRLLRHLIINWAVVLTVKLLPSLAVCCLHCVSLSFLSVYRS